jgi:protein ImuB
MQAIYLSICFQSRLEAAQLAQLGQWAKRYTPKVAVYDGVAAYGQAAKSLLILDVTGCSHLFGGLAAMSQDVAVALRGKGFEVRCAVAPTAALARALCLVPPAKAQFVLVDEGKLLSSVRALPVGVLDVAKESIEFLQHMGFARLGELLRLPRQQLLARFGMELLNAIDALLGDRSSALIMLADEKMWQREENLLEPIRSMDLLLVAIQHMLTPLCKALEEEKKGVQELTVLLTDLERSKKKVCIKSAKPTVQVRRLMRLLELKCAKDAHLLFNGHAMDGGVERIAIAATRVATLRQQQIALDHKEEQMSMKLSTLIDALANRLNEETIFQMLPAQSYIPERAVVRSHDFSHGIDSASDSSLKPAHLGARPLHMLANPEPIVALALLPDHAPIRFLWRSKTIRIVKADGPERIAPEWWHEPSTCLQHETRDYFVVEDERGMRYWIYRLMASNGWFLHGTF